MKEKALELHEKNKGKISMVSKLDTKTREDLSLAYSPGVAFPCLEIKNNKADVYKYTSKGNMIAVVSDGTAVLGLGDIGPWAGLPVMEGKAILFKNFGGVDAVPICLDTKDPDEIIKICKAIAPTFGGINLEDISAPRCFYIEETLKRELDIPVFHDDQHGTAIVVLAALKNACRLLNRDFANLKVVVNGPGAAGTSIIKLLYRCGVKNIIACDRNGILYKGKEGVIDQKEELCKITNFENIKGELKDAMIGRDVFIGVSAANCVTAEMIKSMNSEPIVFAMANPDPEISYDEAKAAGAKIAGTGRSDYPNQINNVLVFPGLFKGVLAAKCKISEEVKIVAADAIASLVADDELADDYIIPSAFDPRVAETVAKFIIEASEKDERKE
ncbi:malic enzyme-like NAD(P)-binding protein [Candidatus Epulonipiscium viviparus]|uniref:NAD(P)-dependent malic enzyme n=1 Tax=Candidatus Epulonipiscium viviparus TaxID=420336 RepID=UPI002ED15F09